MNKVEKRRLLNAAKASRESPNPEEFSMVCYGVCGTPGCVLGHYAARRDLQHSFRLTQYGDISLSDGSQTWYGDYSITEHFGITSLEAQWLFGSKGCDQAQTNIQAASYIEDFVARH